MKRPARKPMTLDEIDALEQEGEIRIVALGLSLPLREVYADVLADLGD